RRVVQGAFESIMHQLFSHGAFAGDTAASSYRVVTDDTINTADDYEQGRFRVDLKVAPAWPMSFITVCLVQEGERYTANVIILLVDIDKENISYLFTVYCFSSYNSISL